MTVRYEIQKQFADALLNCDQTIEYWRSELNMPQEPAVIIKKRRWFRRTK